MEGNERTSRKDGVRSFFAQEKTISSFNVEDADFPVFVLVKAYTLLALSYSILSLSFFQVRQRGNRGQCNEFRVGSSSVHSMDGRYNIGKGGKKSHLVMSYYEAINSLHR